MSIKRPARAAATAQPPGSSSNIGRCLFSALVSLGLDLKAIEASEGFILSAASMLDLPKRVGDFILHYLLTSIDSDKAQKVFRDCWPAYDKRREAQFYRAAFEWYKALVQQGCGGSLPSRLVVSRSVVVPGTQKFTDTLLKLCRMALTAGLVRSGRPPALQQPAPSTAEGRRRAAQVVAGHTSRVCAEFVSLQRSAAEQTTSLNNLAKQMVQLYRAKCGWCEHLRVQLQQQHCSCTSTEMIGALQTVADAAQAEWKRLDLTSAREAKGWGIISPLVQVTSSPTHLDAGVLLRVLSSPAGGLEATPRAWGGEEGAQLDLAVLLKGSARALHTLHASLLHSAHSRGDTGVVSAGLDTKAVSLTACVNELAVDTSSCLRELECQRHNLLTTRLCDAAGGPRLCPPTPLLGVRSLMKDSFPYPLLTASPDSIREILKRKDLERLQKSTVKKRPLLLVVTESPSSAQGAASDVQTLPSAPSAPSEGLDPLLLQETWRARQQRAPSSTASCRRDPGLGGKAATPTPRRGPWRGRGAPSGKENVGWALGEGSWADEPGVYGAKTPRNEGKIAKNLSKTGVKLEKNLNNQSKTFSNRGKPPRNLGKTPVNGGKIASYEGKPSLSGKFSNHRATNPPVSHENGQIVAGRTPMTLATGFPPKTGSGASNLAGKPARKTASCRLFSPRSRNEDKNEDFISKLAGKVLKDFDGDLTGEDDKLADGQDENSTLNTSAKSVSEMGPKSAVRRGWFANPSPGNICHSYQENERTCEPSNGTPQKSRDVRLQDLDPEDDIEKLMERMSFLTKSPYSSPSERAVFTGVKDTRLLSNKNSDFQAAAASDKSSELSLRKLKAESMANIYQLLELSPSIHRRKETCNVVESSNSNLESNLICIEDVRKSGPAVFVGEHELVALGDASVKEDFSKDGVHQKVPTKDDTRKYIRRSGDLIDLLPSIEETAFEKTDVSNLDEFLQEFEQKFGPTVISTHASGQEMPGNEKTVLNEDLSSAEARRIQLPSVTDDEFLDGAVAVALLTEDPPPPAGGGDEGHALGERGSSLLQNSVFATLTDSIVCGETDSAVLGEGDVAVQIARERLSLSRLSGVSDRRSRRHSSSGGRRLSALFHSRLSGGGIMDVSDSILLSTSADFT